ncbi:MAG: DUF1232 domain-containing protein [Acidimicrobiia bacterium]|nr:DUF1232 domain-containing protein [Acidimicrobiia bacterium]
MTWIVGVGVGFCVMAAVGAVLVVVARVLPPGRAKEVVGFVPNCVVLLHRVRRDRRIPWRGRVALGAAAGYVASPIQLIPNVVPVLGQIDDVVVAAVALRYACRHLPRASVTNAWPGDPAYLGRLLGDRHFTDV